jgi:hypothetical protein
MLICWRFDLDERAVSIGIQWFLSKLRSCCAGAFEAQIPCGLLLWKTRESWAMRSKCSNVDVLVSVEAGAVEVGKLVSRWEFSEFGIF